MNNFGKFVAKMGFLSLLAVMPLAAQIDTAVAFKTAFPFYVGTMEMPAGSYRITQPDMNAYVLQVESTDGRHAGFVDFTPTLSAQPHPQSDVSFQKYGDTDYLSRVSIAGENDGIKVDPTKAETRAAATVAQHSTSGGE